VHETHGMRASTAHARGLRMAEHDDERVCICVEAGVDLERARAISLCEELLRTRAVDRCVCGAGHDPGLAADEIMHGPIEVSR
jgi:hypothetical protein